MRSEKSRGQSNHPHHKPQHTNNHTPTHHSRLGVLRDEWCVGVWLGERRDGWVRSRRRSWRSWRADARYGGTPCLIPFVVRARLFACR